MYRLLLFILMVLVQIPVLTLFTFLYNQQISIENKILLLREYLLESILLPLTTNDSIQCSFHVTSIFVIL